MRNICKLHIVLIFRQESTGHRAFASLFAVSCDYCTSYTDYGSRNKDRIPETVRYSIRKENTPMST